MTKRRSLMAATLCCASLLLLGGCGGGSSADVFNLLEKAGQHDAASGADYERGKRQLAAGEYGLAVESFAAEVAHNPNSVRALNGEAIAYAKLGRAEVAKQLFETALAVDQDSPETLNNLAYLHLKQGDPQGALVLAERAKSALTTGTNDKSPPVLSQVLANNEALMRVPLSAQETQQNTVNTAAVQIDKGDADNAVQPKPAAPVVPVREVPLPAAATTQETAAVAPQSPEPATVAVTPQPVIAKTAPRSLVAASQSTAATNPAPQEIAAAAPAPQEAPTPSSKPQGTAVVTQQPPADAATPAPQGLAGVQRPWVTVASDTAPTQTTTSATVPDLPATAAAPTAATAPDRTIVAAAAEPETASAPPAPREKASSAGPPEPAVPAVPPRQPTATGTPPPDRAATMLQAAARASGAKLRIANGSGRHWMAHRFKQYFASRGLNVGTLLNASSFGRPSSVLYYDSDVRAAAQSVAELLPASVRLVEVRGPTGRMDLVMGRNLDPFDIQLAAGHVEPDKLAQR